jgi:hypothetical protein
VQQCSSTVGWRSRHFFAATSIVARQVNFDEAVKRCFQQTFDVAVRPIIDHLAFDAGGADAVWRNSVSSQISLYRSRWSTQGAAPLRQDASLR